MNARQKVKKLKQEIAILKGQAVRAMIVKETRDIVTLGASYTVDNYGQYKMPLPDAYIREHLYRELTMSKDFRRAVEIGATHNPYNPGMIDYVARLDVVTKRRGN